MARLNPRVDKAGELDKNKLPGRLQADPAIGKAINCLDTLYLEPNERRIYEDRLKLRRDHLTELKMSLEESHKKGIEQGIEQSKIELAKILLAILPIDEIAKAVDLPIDTIKKITKL